MGSHADEVCDENPNTKGSKHQNGAVVGLGVEAVSWAKKPGCSSRLGLQACSTFPRGRPLSPPNAACSSSSQARRKVAGHAASAGSAIHILEEEGAVLDWAMAVLAIYARALQNDGPAAHVRCQDQLCVNALSRMRMLFPWLVTCPDYTGMAKARCHQRLHEQATSPN